MGGSNIGALALGVAGGAVGFFAGGITGALYGFTIGATLGGALFAPKQEKGDIRPDELQFTNSTEAQTVPVIFGTVRLPGNHIGYDPSSFKAIEQFEEVQGGKGGSQQTSTGFLYYLTYDVGLCMGEVDELVDVQASPGEDSMLYSRKTIQLVGNYTLSASGNTITRVSGDAFGSLSVGQDVIIQGASNSSNNGEHRITSVTSGVIEVTSGRIASDETADLVIRGETFQAAQDFSGSSITETLTGSEDVKDGGTCIIYPGTMAQTNANGDNFRGVSFARFSNFSIGRSSTPRSYLFTLRRFPVCRDSSGSIIATIPARAANDSSFPEWEDANPAAVLWEVLTQGYDDGVVSEPQWGKGMNPDKLNQSDFETAAAYYQNKRIGISTSMGNGTDTIRGLVGKLQELFGLRVWFDGEQVRCRVFWDRDNAYSPRVRITEEDIVGEPAFTRPSQSSTSNEIRLEFSNRRNNFQKEAITIQDLGNIETVGAIRSESLESKDVGTRRSAHLLANRMLRSMAYPKATCQFNVLRNYAHLQPGDFVEMVWNTWRAGAVTSFWRVVQIEDDDTSDSSVVLTMEEDQFATARDGTISDFTLPIVSIDVDNPLDDGDFDLIYYSSSSELGAITPILAEELPVWVSKRSRRIAVAIQRRNGGIQSFSTGYAEIPFSDYKSLGVSASFAITGTLSGGLGIGPKIIRNTRTDDHFDLVLNVASDESEFLDSTSTVGDSSDSFSLLTSSFQAILIVGNEIIRVGLAEEDSEGIYTIKNAIRGEFGTEIESHSNGDTFWFFPLFDRDKHSIEADDLPRGIATKLRVQAFTGNASSDASIIDGPDSGGFAGRSVKPMIPNFYSATRAGTDWTIKVRPRIHDGGADYGPNLESELSAIETSLGDLTYKIETSDGDSILIGDFFASGSIIDGDLEITKAEFIQSDGLSRETGLVEFNLSFSSNPATISIIPVFSNGISGESLTINQP